VSAHVEVRGLCVAARGPGGAETDIVHDVGFAIEKGEVTALIGESGSGKTTTALTLLGYTRPGCRIRAGSIRIGETDVRRLVPADMKGFRGRRVAYIAQSAAASFNPSHRLIEQVIEGVVVRGLLDRNAAQQKAVALFQALALPDPDRIGRRYPHQVSGGQLQRVMAAMALMSDPELVILDEPTTALDVTTQVEVLRAFRAVVRERGTTAVYVSHDLAVVAQMADDIVVLRGGRVQEAGPAGTLITSPQDPYTVALLDAVPSMHAVPAVPTVREASPVLEAVGLTATYGGPRGVPVLQDVSLEVRPGAVLGVIGESGSGKSTLARVLTGLLPASAGAIRLGGEPVAAAVKGRSKDQLRQMQMVVQMADTALNPAHTVANIVGRPLAFLHGMARSERRRRLAQLLEQVRLPSSLAERLPRDLSGGQKQRVNLARALAAQPALLICDEVTSALDTVVGAAVLDLLAELRRELGLAMLFISHDLATVRGIADEVMVMYAGRAVQTGPRAALGGPIHPYSELLARSVLGLGWLDGLPGTAPIVPSATPRLAEGGYAFARRCALRSEEVRDSGPIPVHTLSTGINVRCVRSEAELAAYETGLRLRDEARESEPHSHPTPQEAAP
jgi:peptide/nickel transport system ATP-binding protein